MVLELSFQTFSNKSFKYAADACFYVCNEIESDTSTNIQIAYSLQLFEFVLHSISNMVSYSKKEIPSSLDLLPLGERYGDKKKALMRCQPNSKFSHIKSSIDHGKKEKKIGLLDNKDQNKLTRRKGENFGRIAPNTLATYITDGRAAAQLSRQLNDIESLRTGRYPTKRPPAENTLPKIILLDLRSQTEYSEGHIVNAISFPAEHIQRDQVFASLGIYKNKADKILVVYHDDERHGILQSRIIFEKGFDNVYLLSGGLFSFEQEFPQLIETRASIVMSTRGQILTTSSPRNQSSAKKQSGFAAGGMVAANLKTSNLPVPILSGGQTVQAVQRGMSARQSTARSKQSRGGQHQRSVQIISR